MRRTPPHVSPNPALRRLDPLIGEWTMRAAVDGRPAGLGRTRFAWSDEGGFLVQCTSTESAEADGPAEWLTNSPYPTTTIIGADGSSGEFTMLFSDSRGTVRVYRMSLTDEVWTIWRDTPGNHQRYVGRFSPDRDAINGRWEESVDGAQWVPDCDLNYERIA